ncbi:MAG: site-specific DNA-methyltransferase [Candidatus Taylorbacteria bacterium]|nr:site-specific DNA-methyltransferase [Candidatus Taylorbacteria bacterium]
MKNTILKGDALKMLKTLSSDSVDVGVTSPPYNKQENKKGWLVKNVKYSGACDKESELKYQLDQVAVLNELFRVIKPGGSFFYNHKTRWERGKMIHPMDWLRQTCWTVRQEIIWDRMIAANIRGWRFWQKDERIYWLYKPIDNNYIGKELLAKHALLSSIWRFPPERNNPHPAPFPLILPARCIYSILDKKSGVVIDPFAGSGTTLVAASLLGKNYIGIDISEEYIAVAKKRLRNVTQEGEILMRELEKHVVRKTFKERKANGDFVGRFREADVVISPPSLF